MNNEAINNIKAKALPILKEAGVRRCALFGSYVRGESKEGSDIDMLVELPEESSLLDLVRLERRLKETLQKDVDLLTYNSLSPLLKDVILQEQFPIL